LERRGKHENHSDHCGGALALGLTLSASTRDSKADILVVPPSALPESAQQASQDLLLHYNGSGTPYLYLEQQQGARLTISM